MSIDISVDPQAGVVNFTTNAFVGSTDPITSVDWDWGDGTAHGTNQSESHTYTTAGTYQLVLTLNGVAQAPIPITVVLLLAVNDHYTTALNTPVSGNVGDNDAAGPNGPANIYQVATAPLHGTIDPWPNDGSFTYTPNTGFNGVDTFTYTLQYADPSSDNPSSTATVTVAVGPQNGPSIEAWYNGRKVLLGLAPNALVFNGFEFVRPQDAKFVAIVETVTVGPENVPPRWPETNTIDQEALTWINYWLCEVIAVGQAPISDRDIVAIDDPNNGACVCGISCQGRDLQYVQVANVTA